MITRRAGGPRLIEWTGERCVPWAPDVQVVYEHYHRYLWARGLAAGARVLDLGSGEGFGAAILAEVAADVVGVDIAADAVAHAQANYEAPKLEFRVGSATDLSDLQDDAFDLVVAFEVIEHVADQEAVLAEIGRVLAPGGRLVISTPDREEYAARGEPNPYHERELTAEEFDALLAPRFPERRLFSQRALEGSRIEAVDGGEGGLPLQIERDGEGWREAAPPSPMYLVVVAGTQPLCDLPAESTLADYGLGLLRSVELDLANARGGFINAGNERDLALQAAAELRAELARSEIGVAQQRADLLAAVQGRDIAVRGLKGELAQARAEHEETSAAAAAEVAAARAQVAAVEDSIAWSLIERARAHLRRPDGRRTLLGRGVSLTLRGVATARGAAEPGPAPVSAAAPPAVDVTAAPAQFDPIALPVFSEPLVSIVIPVHGAAQFTEGCLWSILHSVADVPYEVILVDDDADADTRSLLGVVSGARVISNEENLGYLRSTNRGAAAARGRHIVLLNNDTEPQGGWLRALVDRAESRVDAGIVVGRLVYPDGTLQEAGGIIWRDGTATHYAHGAPDGAADVLYVRSVDYGSAAAMLVRRELWEQIGGFDERYVPCYWEDVDLCFAARDRGWEVIYEPGSRVVHHEGRSMGTDVAAGLKRHQVANAPVFAAKWREALARQPANPSRERAHLASDRRRGPNVLVVDHHVPMPDRDAGSLRMVRLIENLLALGFRVTFASDNGLAIQPYTDDLRAIGVEVIDNPHLILPWIERLGSRLELVVLSRPYVAARHLHHVRRLAPGAKIAYDTVDLHFAREQRRAACSDEPAGGVADAFMHLEIAMARSADVTLAVSDAERIEIEQVSGAPAVVVPLSVDIWDDVPGPDCREGILFVGGFLHEPNVDAVLHLAREVMPLVWHELPDVTLTIVGSSAPPQVAALASPNIDVRGWVERLDPLLRSSRLSVAPVRFGAGANGKVAQSLGAGLPVVTTALGASGFAAQDGVHLFTADDAELMASRIVELHRDPEAWQLLSRAGRELAAMTCGPDVQRRALRGLADGLGIHAGQSAG